MLNCAMTSDVKTNNFKTDDVNNQKVIDQNNAEHYFWGDGCDGWHLLKQPNLSVIYECVPPGSAEVRHYHERALQFFFVLAGEAVLEVAGAIHHLKPQQGLAVAAYTPHQLHNESHEDVLFLVISAPATHALPGHAQDRVAVSGFSVTKTPKKPSH